MYTSPYPKCACSVIAYLKTLRLTSQQRYHASKIVHKTPHLQCGVTPVCRCISKKQIWPAIVCLQKTEKCITFQRLLGAQLRRQSTYKVRSYRKAPRELLPSRFSGSFSNSLILSSVSTLLMCCGGGGGSSLLSGEPLGLAARGIPQSE